MPIRVLPHALVLGRRLLHRGRVACGRGGASSIAILGSATPWDDPAPQPRQDTPGPRTRQHDKSSRRHQALSIHRPMTNQELDQLHQLPEEPDQINEPSFYSDVIDEYACKRTHPITLQSLLTMSEPPVTQAKLVQSARYLGYERPVRYAKRVKLFQQLPFIVNTNPHIHSVYLQYFRNFEESRHHAQQQAQQQQQTWEQQQQEFIRMLARHSDTLKHIMPGIARGFYETRMYFGPRERKQFLDQLITMRIGLRLLTSQHLALYCRYRDTVDDPVADQADCDRFGGIVDSNGIDLKQFVHTCAQGVQAMCEMALGDAPRFIIDGDAGGAAFRYVPSHLEYMVIELLKNAFRASLNHQPEGNSPPPPVLITVSHGCGKVAIRIRDRGGGIPRRIHARVFDYSFTTEEAAGDQGDPTATLAAVSDGHGPFAGLGFGLPMTKIYAEYFGGSLHLISLEDYGCDVFLELPSIEPAHASKIHI